MCCQQSGIQLYVTFPNYEFLRLFEIVSATLDTLDKCKADIESSCTFSVNDTRFAEIEQCYKDAESFYSQVDKCQNNGKNTTTEACSCFDALDLDALMAKVTACDVSKDNAAVNKEKKKCKKSKTERGGLKKIFIFIILFEVLELARLHR